MADQTFSSSQMLVSAVVTLISGGLFAEVVKKLMNRPKEQADVKLIDAQTRETISKIPSPESIALKTVLETLDLIQRTSSERDKAAADREGILRAHIEGLEAKIDELSKQLDRERLERQKLQNLQRLLNDNCYSCPSFEDLAHETSIFDERPKHPSA